MALRSSKRSPLAPDVPTFVELGIPDYEYKIDIGITAPASTARDIISKLSNEVAKAVNNPDTQQRFRAVGIEPSGSTPEVYAARIRSDYERFGRAIRLAGITAN
ncbi:MAG: hypothetical protein EPO20_05755 [Betaproteobacteria bacterium]|nr:MAG: hypothetical protein EPO20_05755 [Betaproteobacteria bacterium]